MSCTGPMAETIETRACSRKSNRRVVIEHVSEPKHRLTIRLAPSPTGTVVSWSQTFERPEVAARIEHIVVPANEENLDRLTGEVLRAIPKDHRD